MMDDMNAFDRQLASVVHRRVGPSEPVDDLAIYTSIVAATPSPKWRFQSMFNATKFVVGGAIVALFGGFILAGVLTQPSEEQVPAVGAPGLASAQPDPTAQAEASMDGLPEGSEDAFAGILFAWVSEHRDPNSLDHEEGETGYTLFYTPELSNVMYLADEAWCKWVSSYMNDSDGRPDARGVRACVEHIATGAFDEAIVPATYARFMLAEPEPPSGWPADGPVSRTGSGSGTSDPFRLDGGVKYKVTVGAPVGCADLEVGLQMRGAPEWQREPLREDGGFYWEDTNEWVLGVATDCDGRWAIVVEEATE